MTNNVQEVKFGGAQALTKILEVDDKDWMPYLNVQELLDFINPIDGELVLDKRSTEVFIRPLPFYNKTKLIKVQNKNPEDEPISLFYLQQDDDLVVMNGMSDHIREINETGDLNITDETVFDYLKFFSVFIDDEETQQPFYIIENELSEFISHFSPYEKKRVLRKFEGSSVESIHEGKQFKISTRVLFGSYIFDADFKIAADGEVVMENDQDVGSI